MTKVECYSDRLMIGKISAKPVDVGIVQVYMPTTDPSDEIEEIYGEISDILQQEEVKGMS